MLFETINSRQNPKIQEACSLKDKKTRREKGLFFFEGLKLFEEAVKRQIPLQTIFFQEGVLLDPALLNDLPANCRIFRVNDSVYKKLTEEKSPEGVFCIAKTIDKYHKFATIYNIPENFQQDRKSLLMAVSLRDPGNLGTIIRSAAAFGCTELILTEDCADLYSAKTVRASMGTLFDCPITVVRDPAATIKALKAGGIRVYGSALQRGALKLNECRADEDCCFLVGNEGHGLPAPLLDLCDAAVFIPMTENAESLNASIAASILLYSRFIYR